jgi:hypothetical protein
MIVTDAGVHPNVSAIVYVAARAPDAGEDYTALAKTYPAPPASAGTSQRVTAFGCPRPRRSLAREGNLLPTEARLVADHGAGAALALQAAAHGDARWFALN